MELNHVRVRPCVCVGGWLSESGREGGREGVSVRVVHSNT